MAKTLTLGSTPTASALGRVLHTRIIKRRYQALNASAAIGRQQAIENALCMALFHVRNSNTQQGIQAATAKAMRAASMLKQACTEFAIGGGA